VPKVKKNSAPASTTAATVGYEAQLWQMVEALRGSSDAAEYKHVCLGLLFLKYISDAFEEKRAAPRGQDAVLGARALPRPGVRALLRVVQHQQARASRLSILAPSDNAIGQAPPQTEVTREP
jgi:hypothetical protein